MLVNFNSTIDEFVNDLLASLAILFKNLLDFRIDSHASLRIFLQLRRLHSFPRFKVVYLLLAVFFHKFALFHVSKHSVRTVFMRTKHRPVRPTCFNSLTIDFDI